MRGSFAAERRLHYKPNKTIMLNITKLNRLYGLLGVLAVVLFFSFGIGQASAAIDRTMGPGSSGQSVSDLQVFLATDPAVYPEGLVTGFYGSLTTTAVQRFQTKYSIVVSGSVSTTGYGRVGPVTLAKILEVQGDVIPTPNPSGDESAPIINLGGISTSVGSNSATIHWTTNEAARSRVMYGTIWPFLYASAPSFSDSTVDTNSNVNLTGLTPNMMYYYILESIDASGNLQWTTAHSFKTNS